MPFDLRFIVAAVLLAGAAIVLDVRRNYEIVPPRLPLQSPASSARCLARSLPAY